MTVRGWLSVHKNDLVMVIAGKDKGKRGKVLSVVPETSAVVVERINIVKRHSRPGGKTPHGGIVEKEAPLHVSNVMVVCSRCDRPVRTGHSFLADGRKVRVCKQCGEAMD
ncbi:MAG: 50S ribosomal protein L24 [candidate division NC10 bacterium]|jgi:large subunit ribosomal protein L24|nr:50S ribosomal protein L24 [candidate division NC10 bacterium]MCH7896569.1 50S ribosomal protein L24 [candidate division NC10 bacterium]MCZ6550125.1 50S ribosomal protein L24 [candidate division NC10 bacterium]